MVEANDLIGRMCNCGRSVIKQSDENKGLYCPVCFRDAHGGQPSEFLQNTGSRIQRKK